MGDVKKRTEKTTELRQLNRTLRALSQNNQAIMRASSEAKYVREVCRIVVNACDHTMTWIGLAEHDEAKTVRPVAHAGFEDGYLKKLNITWCDTERGRGPTGTAIRTGKITICRNMTTDPHFAPWRAEALKRGYASSLVLPLFDGGKVLGAINIYSKEPDPFSGEEVRLLSELADDVAYGIRVIRLREAHAQAEQALRASEERARSEAARMQALLDAAPAAVWIAHDRKCRKITGNRTATEFLRLSADADMAKSGAAGLRKKNYRVFENGVELKLQEMPLMRVASSGQPLKDCTLDFVFADGEMRSMAGNVTPLFDAQGCPDGAIGTFIDITERKRATEALRQFNATLEERVIERTAELRAAVSSVTAERRHFHEALDALPAYVVLLSPDYHVPFANRFFEGRFGKSDGRRCYEYLFRRTEPCENCESYKVLRTNGPHHWEWLGPDGRNYDVHDLPFTDVDGSPLVMEVGFDVTERKQAERQLTERTTEVQHQADQLRALATDLSRTEQRERKRLSNILHDHLQQLLVAARMQAEWLKRDHTPEQRLAAAHGIDNLLKEAIEASRSLAVELSPPILHTAGLIGGLNWLASRILEKNRFLVHLRTEDEAEPPTEELRFLLFECTRELLLNTMKHADVSEAQITLVRASDGRIKLTVSDAGKGFDADLLTKRRTDEASFGLFNIQQRLAHIGGQMEIYTEPGKGTSIAIVTPADMARPGQNETDEAALEEQETDNLGISDIVEVRRVLIVDDHRIMREGLAGLMQYEPDIEIVGQAANGQQAIELAEKLKPDVVVIDVNLGGMSGIEATKKILARNPNMVVIGLSMHTSPDIADAMHTAGAIAYMSKGGPSEELIAAIREHTSGAHGMRASLENNVAHATGELVHARNRDDSNGKKIRVLVADDNKPVRQMLVEYLRNEDDIELVGEAEDGEEAIRLALAMRPDVVITDLNMPKMNGIETTKKLSMEMPCIRVIGLSAYDDADSQTKAIRAAGAVDCVLKESSCEKLIAAIRAACAAKS